MCGVDFTTTMAAPDYGFHQQRIVKVQGIVPELHKMGFCGKVADIANDIYIQISNGKIYRGNSRKSIIFACVFNSYRIIDNPQPFNNILSIFNISKKVALKGLKIVAHHAPNRCIEIKDDVIVKQILTEFGSYHQHYYDSIMEIYTKVQDKSGLINRSRPSSVICGIIYYFIVSTGKSIDLAYFSNKNGVSELTTLKICKAIDSVLDTTYFSSKQT